MQSDIYIHEDIINQIQILPEENYFSSAVTNRTIYNENETYGFYEIVERIHPLVPLIKKNITLSEIEEILKPTAISSSNSIFKTYGQTSIKIDNMSCYIYERVGIFVKYNQFQILEDIFTYSISIASKNTNNSILPKVLLTLGERYNLILVDWDEEVVIRLCNPKAVNKYLSEKFNFLA